ncbi:MAG: tetratricopeptide repeat protein [Spirochaetaceae bacterium]
MRRLVLLLALFSTAGTLWAQERPDALELYRSRDYEAAVEVTLQEIEDQPRNMDAYTVLGWSLLALDRYEDALQYGLRALEVSRFDVRIIHIVAEAHYYLDNYLDALGYFEEYIAVAPTGDLVDQVYFTMGEIFLQFGEYHHADAALSTAVYLDDGRASWWSRLGFAREQAQDYDHALEAYDRALELNPDLAEAARGRERVEAELAG